VRAGGERWRRGSGVHVQPRPHHARAPTPSRHHPTDAVVTALVTALPARGAPAHPAPGVSLCETSTRAVVCAPLSPRRSHSRRGGELVPRLPQVNMMDLVKTKPPKPRD